MQTDGNRLVTGFANGLFGSGGGTIVVPAMERFLGEEEHKGACDRHCGDSALIPALSGGLSLESGFGRSLADCVLGIGRGTVGGFVGAKLLQRVSGVWLHRIFGAFMLAAAVRLIL